MQSLTNLKVMPMSKSLPKDLQKTYNAISNEHKSIVDSILFASENDEYNPSIRPRPKYSDGSVDEMMFPIQPKARTIAERILRGDGYIYVVEGGARGG